MAMRLLALALIALLLPVFGQARPHRRVTRVRAAQVRAQKHKREVHQRPLLRRLPRSTYGTWV